MAERSADEALTVGFYRCMLDNAYFMHGICRECAGSISVSVSVCSAHRTQTEDPCPHCGTHSRVWATQRCETCGFAKRLPVEVFTVGLTPVIGFLDEHGIDVLAPSLEEIVDLLRHRVETTISNDPFRVTVSIEEKKGTLDVSLDEELNVTSLHRPRPN